MLSILTVYSCASYNMSCSDDVSQDCACPDIMPVTFQLAEMAEASCGNDDIENIEPKPKKKCLSLKKSVKTRFKMTSSPEIVKAKKGFIPVNTQRSTDWAVRTFETWRRQRNVQSPASISPDDILLVDDDATLCHWLCVFCKARKEDGELYSLVYHLQSDSQ